MRVTIVSIVSGHGRCPSHFISSSLARASPGPQSERLHFTLAKRASVFAGLSHFLAFASFYPSVLPIFFLFFPPLLINASYVYASCLGAASREQRLSGQAAESRERASWERELFMVLGTSRRRYGEHNYLRPTASRIKTVTRVRHSAHPPSVKIRAAQRFVHVDDARGCWRIGWDTRTRGVASAFPSSFFIRARVSVVNDGPRIIHVRVVYRLRAAW